MADNETLQSEESEVPPPEFVVPGIRCALEMALVGMAVALVGLPASSDLHAGVILVVALLAMVVVLFWCLNQQMAEWIRHAQGRPSGLD